MLNMKQISHNSIDCFLFRPSFLFDMSSHVPREGIKKTVTEEQARRKRTDDVIGTVWGLVRGVRARVRRNSNDG